MYAVIASGGKQYKVAIGQTLKVEKLPTDVGGTVQFPMLLTADGDKVTMGAPHIAGKMVSAEVISHGRGEKVRIIKMRRRKHFRKQMGHRQDFTEVKVTAIG